MHAADKTMNPGDRPMDSGHGSLDLRSARRHEKNGSLKGEIGELSRRGLLN